MARSVYLHLPLPKTASLTQQKHFFPKHERVAYLGLGPRNVTVARPGADFTKAAVADPAPAGAWRAEFQKVLAAVPQHYDKVLISHEYPMGNDAQTHRSLDEILQRLKEIFEPSGVIITLRDPVDYLKSLSAHYYSDYNYPDFDTWFARYMTHSHLNDLEFDRLMALAREHFSPATITPLLFEQFATAPERYMADFYAALGETPPQPAAPTDLREHSRKSRRRLAVERCRRRLLPRVSLRRFLPRSMESALDSWLNRGKPATMMPSADLQERLVARFKASNARCQAQFGVPLSDYFTVTAPPSESGM